MSKQRGSWMWIWMAIGALVSGALVSGGCSGSSPGEPAGAAEDGASGTTLDGTRADGDDMAAGPSVEPGANGAGDGAHSGVEPASNVTPSAEPQTIPDDCQGFPLLGLRYSPGGDVLPNTCLPFDTTTNNPYAIRCIDADPSYASGFLGDEYCILPPPPELGTQVRVGPDSYDNIPDGFVLEPGEEIDNYYHQKAPNAEAHHFYRVNLRMRAGSHHMINRMLAEARPDGWSDTGVPALRMGESGDQGFPGAQRPDQDRPNGTLAVPPENQGHGQRIEANQQFSFNLHHFNVTDEPTLREVWVNIWYKPADDITEALGSIAMVGNPNDINIAPGEQRMLHYECPVEGNTRIVTLNGHRHAWTDRFGAWIERRDGSIDQVYESYQYSDMPTYQYDSISDNPAPDLDRGLDGATSGILTVSPGDRIHFVCDINNGSEQRLRFANEVLTGEMCILFGSSTGDPLGCRFLMNTPLP